MTGLVYEAVTAETRPTVDRRLMWSDALGAAKRASDQNRFADVLAVLRELSPHTGPSDLVLRGLLLESWASMALGRLDQALALAQRAHDLAASPEFVDLDRADVMFHLGCCRLKRSDGSMAVSLFTVALELCDRSLFPCDRLRGSILHWRSRCYQRQRDWPAARNDLDRALELAAAIDDRPTLAHANFQSSAVAERTGDLSLARYYAEEAELLFREADDKLMLAKITNNLGGIVFLLGDPTRALLYLEDAIRTSLEIGSDVDAAQAISSTARIQLELGHAGLAEGQARNALEVLAGRDDFLDEIGNAQLVLARSLFAQERHAEAEQALAQADTCFERLGSVSHRAAGWIALADVRRARGDVDGAATTYRAAAEALQDFRF